MAFFSDNFGGIISFLLPMRWREFAACVGLIVSLGGVTLVIAPNVVPDPHDALTRGQRPIVVIDAGHGGNDGGAAVGKLLEKNLTLELALLLERRMQRDGFHTLLTRRDDRYIPLQDRVAMVNALNEPAIFVSLHFNTGRGAAIHGIETFYTNAKAPVSRGWRWVGFFSDSEELDTGEYLASSVQKALVSRTGARDRGIRQSDFYVIRNTWSPAILIEGGFLTNKSEAGRLREREYMMELCHGIAEGIRSWCETYPELPPPALPIAERGAPATR